MDSLCVELPDPKIMKRPPVKKGTDIFQSGLLSKIITISLVFTVVTLLSIYTGIQIGNNSLSTNSTQSMTFLVLGLSSIVHVYSCRSNVSIFKIGLTSNRVLLGTTLLGAIIIVLVTIVYPFNAILGLMNIALMHWFIVIILSILPLIFIEIQKALGKFGEI